VSWLRAKRASIFVSDVVADVDQQFGSRGARQVDRRHVVGC